MRETLWERSMRSAARNIKAKAQPVRGELMLDRPAQIEAEVSAPRLICECCDTPVSAETVLYVDECWLCPRCAKRAIGQKLRAARMAAEG